MAAEHKIYNKRLSLKKYSNEENANRNSKNRYLITFFIDSINPQLYYLIS